MADITFSLSEYQQRMARFLFSACPVNSVALAQVTGTTHTGTRDIDGFKVYRNNVLHSLTEALAAQFPVVARLVGDDFFRALARDYVIVAPPVEAALTWYGHDFADYIRNHRECKPLPYLPDVATLELLCQRALHASDAPALQLQNLAAVPVNKLACLYLHLHPSVFFFSSSYPVVRIWQANIEDDSETIDLSESQASNVLIYRRGFQVQVVSLQPAVWCLLQELQQTSLETAWFRVQQRYDLPDAELTPMIAYLLGLDVFSHFTLATTNV